MATTSKSLAELLDENKEFISLTENGLRIKCLITPHEMPPRADAVQAYLTSAKFKKAKEWYSQDFSKYEPFLVRDKKSDKKLFCRITRTRVNLIPTDVEKHVNGKRFLRLKQNYLDREAKRESGIDEDDDEEEEGAEGDIEDGDGGEDDDIDVDEEAAAAAAAGVWMPKEELTAIVSGFKVKKSPKHTKGSKTEVVDEMDEGDEDEEEEEGADSGAGDEEASVNSEDSDIHLYIREVPPKPVIKAKALAKSKGEGKGKGKAKGYSDANGKGKEKGKSKSKSESVHTADVAETEPVKKRAAATQIKGSSKKVRN